MSLKDRGINQGHLQPVVVVALDGQDALPISSTIDNEITSLIQGEWGGEGDIANVRLDASTETMQTIDYVHHEIHSGSTYHVSYLDIALANNGTIEFIISTGAKECHLIFEGTCGGNALLEFFEEPTTVAGGTAMAERNKNRVVGDGGNTATVVRDPASIGGDETMLIDKVVPGGTGGNATGGTGGVRDEWVLNVNTDYLIRFTNVAGTAKPTALDAEFYEHTPRNV